MRMQVRLEIPILYSDDTLIARAANLRDDGAIMSINGFENVLLILNHKYWFRLS